MTISKYHNIEDSVYDDPYADAFTVISEEHRMIHDGYMFNLSGKATGIANGGTYDLLFVCGSGVFLHVINMEYTIDDAPALIELYEGTTYSAAGTSIDWVNHSRVSANTADTVATHTPTVTSPGTLVAERYIPDPGGSAGHTSGSIVQGGDYEWILGNGDDYLWRFTNNSGGAIDIGFHFNAYEIGATP